MTYLIPSMRPIIIVHGKWQRPGTCVGSVGITEHDGEFSDGRVKRTVFWRETDGALRPEYGLYGYGEWRKKRRWLYVYGTREEVAKYDERLRQPQQSKQGQLL